MNVRELIEKLAEMDPDLPVFYDDDHGEWGDTMVESVINSRHTEYDWVGIRQQSRYEIVEDYPIVLLGRKEA